MLTRRELLRRGLWVGAAACLLPTACAWPRRSEGEWVNDIHSQLNRTRVRRIARPSSVEEVQRALRTAVGDDLGVSIMGGRHAMGGQQFGHDTLLIDSTSLRGIVDFDPDQGQVEVLAGTQWPELVNGVRERQHDVARPWGIVQKQSGADRLSLGGALAANGHGRGLKFRPIIQDVEAFTLVDAEGQVLRCSRTENPELFALAIGGYGLFGVVVSVRLRLTPRRRVERVVRMATTDELTQRFEERIAQGYLYGDCQFSTDPTSEAFLREGVFSCYRPVEDTRPLSVDRRELKPSDWLDLLALAHGDRTEAFRLYSSHYLKTDGQIYDSDTHQMAGYVDDYHRVLGDRIGEQSKGTEMITEVYVPRSDLHAFLEDVRTDFLEHQVPLIYGTIRLVERDDESFLAWAREPWACVIFNLHTAHDAASLDVTARHFRRLINRARHYGGSYFLTYHRWATKEQVEACHPKMKEFLEKKDQYDPAARFQSDWWRRHRELLS